MIGDYPINLYNQNFEISHSFISYNGDPQELNNRFSRVRNNFLSFLSQKINNSIFLNFALFCLSFAKVSLTGYLLFGDVCTGNILVWMILNMVYDMVNGLNLLFFLVCIFLSRAKNLTIDENSNENSRLSDDHYSSQTKYTFNEMNDKSVHLKYLFMTDEFCKLFYFVLSVYGNISILSEKQCPLENPFFWEVSLYYLFLSILYFLIPVIGIFSVCFCFPSFLEVCRLFCLHVFNARSEKQHPYLKQIFYVKGDEEIQVNECCLCISQYKDNDEIGILNCNPSHHFHYSCIKKWLNVSETCPLCKRNLRSFEALMEEI